jgi:hypothetical protein
MAWSWQTYREWTNSTTGYTVKVVVAAGLLASGGLLWWERAQPRYPTARDEAEIIGALQERAPTYWHFVTWARFPVLTEGVWTNELQYNAVGLYPRRSLYTYVVSNTVAQLCSSNKATYAWPRNGYTDLCGGGGTEGNYRLWGRPWDGTNMLPIADGEIMDLAWWHSNIWADAGHFGDFAYIHRKPFYMGTNMLNEIGKALSAFRWTWEEGSDPTNGYPYSAYSFLVRTGTSEFEEPVDAETAIDAACANMAWVSPYTSAELENLELASHYAYVAGVDDYGAIVYERITTKYVERVYDRTVSYFAPVVTGTVARVTEHAVLRALYAESMRDYDRWVLEMGPAYYHGRGFNTNIWEAVELEAEELEGHTTEAYRSFIRTFEGGFDTGDMQTLLGPDCGTMGWSSGPQCFVVDWRFQCLTNRAAFWD